MEFDFGQEKFAFLISRLAVDQPSVDRGSCPVQKPGWVCRCSEWAAA